MSPVPPTRRRWFQFSLGAMLVVVTVLALLLGWRVNRRPAPPIVTTTATAGDVRDLIAALNRPSKKLSFVSNIWAVAADRLGELGPLAKQNGAVEALQAFIAQTNDAEAKQAAEEAIKKLNRY